MSRKEQTDHFAAMEVCHSQVHLVVCDRRADGGYDIHAQSLPWRVEATSLFTDAGINELTLALKSWVARYRLHGLAVHMALNGDYCVTRVASGDNDKVRQELGHLEQRSNLYLSLGPGPKALGGSVHQIDARHQTALLTVVNQKTLTALMEVGMRLGIKLNVIEPALVSLCRVVGRLEGEVESPALVINLSEKGVDVGMAHRGRLVLDYRPAGSEANDEVAKIVARHLSRLQRYCDRYLRLNRAKLDRVYLCGNPETVAQVAAAFQAQGELRAIPLDPAAIDSSWTFLEGAGNLSVSAALGTCLREQLSPPEFQGPNLLERLRAQTREPLLPNLVRFLWPVAATLLVAAGVWGWVSYEHTAVVKLEAEVEEVEPARRDYRLLETKTAQAQGKIKQLQGIASALPSPHWQEIAGNISRCLPDDVWLDTVKVNESGKITLVGASYTEDGVFEFVRWLRKYQAVDQVSVSSTRLVRLATGPATQFDIQCNLIGRIEKKGGKHGSG